MSRKAYSVWDYPSNTKTNPIPPTKSSQGRAPSNPTVAVPQGQKPKTAQKKPQKPENTIPMERQLYREALEAQTAASQYPKTKTPKQAAEKPMSRQEQGNSEQLNRKQQEILPQQKQTQPQQKQTLPRQKQTLPQWNQKRPDVLRKTDEGYETAEERHQREIEEAERRREEREALEAQEEAIRQHWEEIEQARLKYEKEQQRRERWNGFGEQFQDILEKGGNALAGEWDSFWDNDERIEYWGKEIEKNRESFSDLWNYIRDPFGTLKSFYTGKASPTDSEYLQKMTRRGATMYDFIKDPMPYFANYLTGEAAVTDSEGLQRAAELGKENNLLNFIRYYGDTQIGGFISAVDSLFGGNEDSWLDRTQKNLMEEARDNYDHIIDSNPPFLRKKAESGIADVESWIDQLLTLPGGMPAGLPRVTRTFGKAKDEAARKGYSPSEQTAYALNEALQEFFVIRTDGYGLNEKDRKFLKAFGDYISGQKGLVEAIKSAGDDRFFDLMESILMLVEPGIDRVLNGTEEPDIKEIPDIFDDMVDNLLDQVEEKVDAWQEEAWEPKETLPEEIWGLPEYDYDGETERSLLPADGETDAETLWDLPEETENAGNPKENWYTEEEEKRIPPQGPLPANTTYLAGEFGYEYETDSQGRLSSWHAPELQLTERTGRLPYVHNTPGKQPGDHAGHLAGDRFGGSGKLDNLVSQYWLVNLSSYKVLENKWHRAIQAGKAVEVDVEVVYAGDDLRPSKFIIVYFIDGVEYHQTITNDLLGGLGL